ncbi:MAG: Type 1 glutamine amidotransferase-like domain-containing protein [Clostridia bacterium]|nr:Type 1 glutamine amidotransferase-like domain-containing protein [Clostridia bacterium]
MIYFLTSSPFQPDACLLNPDNGQIEEMKKYIPNPGRAVFVCSSPDLHDLTVGFGLDMRIAFEAAGFFFSDWQVLDGANAEDAQKLVLNADLLIFAGGHVPTQNAFFQKIRLRTILKDYQGVVVGISAGTMNCCDPVYAQPEEPGEAINPEYQRFLPGLGITETMILPHYQKVKDDRVDGLHLFQEITLPDSRGRTFYALPDGSYLLGRNGSEAIYGEAWRIQNGVMELVSRKGERYPLK